MRLRLFTDRFLGSVLGLAMLSLMTNVHSQEPTPEVSATKKSLDAIRLTMLTGSSKEAKQASTALKELANDKLTSTERELWLRLSREAALRLGDRTWLESLSAETDSFETQMIYRVLLASGQLEKGDLKSAAETLDQLGDLDAINEREKRRVFAIRARIAQLNGDVAQERVHIEAIMDHLDRWPTNDCQSCHSSPTNPKAITTMPIQRLWFGERFVELMKLQSDAEAVKVESEKELAKNSADDRARIRLAFAFRALGNEAKAKELFAQLPWAEAENREPLKPRMMTTFP